VLELQTFLDLLQASTDAFVRPADYIYACNFFWVCLLQFVQRAQRIYAKGVCATE
jgi:hypothetical protein